MGNVNLIFSLDEFSPPQPISRGQSGIYEREKREEALLSRLFSVIISSFLIKLTIPFFDHCKKGTTLEKQVHLALPNMPDHM